MNRAERRARTDRVVARRKRFVHGGAPIGRCRDRHPHDCGHTQCLTCHAHKVFDTPKPADVRRLAIAVER